MQARRSAMRATVFGLITAGSLALVACTPPAKTGATVTTGTGGSLTACTVSASDLTPSSAGHGAPQSVAGLTGQKVTADGSSALQPFIKQAAAEFDTVNGTQSTINAGGSGQGLKDVQAGAVQIGMSDVFASEKAPTAGAYDDLVDH